MDLLVKSIMQPPSIGETDFTCSVVPVTGARENVTQINRRVVKRDCVYRRFLFLSIYIYILFIIPLTALSSAAA